MWWNRFLANVLLPIFAALAILSSDTAGQQGAPLAKPAKADASSPKGDAPKADESATKTVTVAAEMLDPQKLGWVEATLWQKVDTQGLSFTAAGRYLAGPDHRLRIDLDVSFGKTVGKMQVTSDGATLWSVMQIAGGEPDITRLDLRQIKTQLDSPGTSPKLREEFFKAHSFTGLAMLMQALGQQLVFTRQEPDRWMGKEALKLTGVWAPELVKQITNNPANWPAFVPRTCRLFVDKQTLWPYRLEWLGPTGQDPDDNLLMQLEFRDPKFTKGGAEPPAFATAFQYDPGKAKVIDRTQEVTSELANVTKQMTTQPKPAGVPAPVPSGGQPKPGQGVPQPKPGLGGPQPKPATPPQKPKQ